MSREVGRYGVYLADLNPTRGREIAKTRPVVVSQDAMNRHLDTVVVCPLTTKLHSRWRSRIQCSCAGRRAEIAVDQIRTVSKGRPERFRRVCFRAVAEGAVSEPKAAELLGVLVRELDRMLEQPA